MEHIPLELRDSQPFQILPSDDDYTKTLGIEWNANKDHFRLTIAEPPPRKNLTERGLTSDIAKTFDILGWFLPSTTLVKILLQKLSELKVDWDDPIPTEVRAQWRSELPLLATKHIPRCYFPADATTAQVQLHGFSDASERAYGAVVYIRTCNETGDANISLLISKTKVAPIKRLSIPRLELCGAQLLAQLMHHVRRVL